MGVVESGYRPITTELWPAYSPEVIVFDTPDKVAKYGKARLVEQVLQKPTSVLTLPTGSTPVGMYGLVAQAYREQRLDLSDITVFNLDEYWPLPPGHAASYAEYMRTHLYQHVNVPVSQRNIPNSGAVNPHDESARYESALRQRIVDLAILGIGPGDTCHIGFNERGSSPRSRTRYVKLDPQTLAANVVNFPDASQMPQGAITQGVGNILEAQQLVLMATGTGKAEGIRRTLEGDIGPDAPASYLRYHRHVTFVLDSQAASLLS